MIMALTKTLTRDKGVSKMSWANVILTLIPPLMHVKGGNQICYGFATTFDQRQRRGQTCQLL